MAMHCSQSYHWKDVLSLNINEQPGEGDEVVESKELVKVQGYEEEMMRFVGD